MTPRESSLGGGFEEPAGRAGRGGSGPSGSGLPAGRERPTCDICADPRGVVEVDTSELRPGTAGWIRHLCSRCFRQRAAESPPAVVAAPSPTSREQLDALRERWGRS